MFFAQTYLILLPLTDLSHLVKCRFLSAWLHFQGILQLTLCCCKLFIQWENNLWFLTLLHANGCHPYLTFRHTVSWELGYVCIKPASCHSILISTIEKQKNNILWWLNWKNNQSESEYIGNTYSIHTYHLCGPKSGTYFAFICEWSFCSRGPSFYHQFFFFFSFPSSL